MQPAFDYNVEAFLLDEALVAKALELSKVCAASAVAKHLTQTATRRIWMLYRLEKSRIAYFGELKCCVAMHVQASISNQAAPILHIVNAKFVCRARRFGTATQQQRYVPNTLIRIPR